MTTKTELLLVKRTMVEAVLEAAQKRTDDFWKNVSSDKQAGIFDKMMKDWEALTAMKVEDGVAIIPLRGTITPDDPFAAYFGETSLSAFLSNFNEAMANDAIHSIVLNVYSPGGFVYGVEGAANAIYQARSSAEKDKGKKKKSIVAFTDTLAASAAYWVASAADKVYLGSESAEVGSIGVYLAHFDYSAMLEGMGIKVTEITSGEFKGIGSPYAELTEADKKLLQADCDYIYTRFVNTVARNRGLSVKEVLKSANGLTFYGSDAIERGLADSINTLQEVIAMSKENDGKSTVTTPTDEEKAKAEQEAQAVAALKADNDRMAAELAAYRQKDEAAKAEAVAAECKEAVKAAFGREATAEEVSMYQSLSEDGRKTYKANLEESAKSRNDLFAKAGLGKEVATEGREEEHSADKNPIVLAARQLGFAVAPKQ